MRTKGKKIFYIAVVMVGLGLLTVGCSPVHTYKGILPTRGQSELSITIAGNPTNQYDTLFTVQGDNTVVGGKNDIVWIYDRADDQSEYAIVEHSDDRLLYIYLHLRTSKKPK